MLTQVFKTRSMIVFDVKMCRYLYLFTRDVCRLGYMHRDLKSLNVFLDERMVAKVAA